MKMTAEYSTHPSVACNNLSGNDVTDSKAANAKVINKAILAKLPPCCQVTTIAGTNGSSCKKMAKSDGRLGGSSFRHILPIALCLFSFAVVFTVLLLYMDTDQIRHQQFRLNMSRDYELNNVAQDNPELVTFLREFHMKKHPMRFLKKEPFTEHLNFTERHEQTPEMAQYISSLVGSKLNRAYIQSMTGSTGNLLTGPWLTETLSWSGTILEPEPRRYFALRKQNVHRPKVQIVHACISPNEHAKEVTIHNEDDVRINSLLDEETLWSSRVKCFPLYTIMLAVNRVEYDLLSLGVHGQELDILKTLPFDKVKIEVISIHLTENIENIREYSQAISKFLGEQSYRLQKTIGFNYIYQKVNVSRSKKKA